MGVTWDTESDKKHSNLETYEMEGEKKKQETFL